MKTKVLIVEDETIVALDIKNVITKLGYRVINCVTNYDDAIKSVNEDDPDIILMDINLKNSQDGIQTAQDILNIKYIPIIYLTAYSDDETMDRAVETNPIGYLIKPFKREELKSTMKLSIYKINNSNQTQVNTNYTHIGLEYYFDLDNDNLYYQNLLINLTSKEKQLLKILILARGNVVSFEQLEYDIWPDNPISNSTLRTLLYRIKTKLEHKLIENIHSCGCKLIVPSN